MIQTLLTESLKSIVNTLKSQINLFLYLNVM